MEFEMNWQHLLTVFEREPTLISLIFVLSGAIVLTILLGYLVLKMFSFYGLWGILGVLMAILLASCYLLLRGYG